MSNQVGPYSPPLGRELYSPPAPFDPLASNRSESSEPPAEEPSESAKVPYGSEIYTYEPKFNFVDPEPVITIRMPIPKADETRKPEASPRSECRRICNNQVIGASLVIGGMIGIAIGIGLIFSIKSLTASLATGVSVLGASTVVIGIGICWMTRMDDDD
jgi:hypothetical protein